MNAAPGKQGLPELLETLYCAHRDVRAMVLEIRDWSRQDPGDVLVVQPGAGGGVRARWMAGGPNRRPVAQRRRLWFQPPDRLRVEVLGGGMAVRAAVRDGSAWWRWDREEGESAGDIAKGAPLPTLLDPVLLAPARLLSTMWFEVTGTGSRASRRVMTATGTPRQASDGTGSRRDFEFDLEHGTPLHMATFDAGEHLSVTEVLSVDYAAAIDPAVFRFQKLGTTDGQPSGADPAHRWRRPAQANAPGEHRLCLATGQTIWLTGLPGAGKTTIARATERLLHQLGAHCCVLDGDQLRQGLSSDLGFSREGRGEQSRRVAHVAALLADSGAIPIVALVSPYAEDRQQAREIHDAAGVGFIETWVCTPLEVCVARDPKGLYAGAPALSAIPASGGTSDGSGLTGLRAPYEEPVNPDLRISGYGQRPRVAAREIVQKLCSGLARTSVLLPR